MKQIAQFMALLACAFITFANSSVEANEFDACMASLLSQNQTANSEAIDPLIANGVLVEHLNSLLDDTLSYYRDGDPVQSGAADGLYQNTELIERHLAVLTKHKQALNAVDRKTFEHNIVDFAKHMLEVAAANRQLEAEQVGTLRGLEEYDHDLFDDLIEGAYGHSASRIVTDAKAQRKKLPQLGIGETNYNAFHRAQHLKFFSPSEVMQFTSKHDALFHLNSTIFGEAELLFYLTMRSAMVGKNQASEEGIFQLIEQEVAKVSASSLSTEDKYRVAKLLLSGMEEVGITPKALVTSYTLETMSLPSLREFLAKYADMRFPNTPELSFHDLVMAHPESRNRYTTEILDDMAAMIPDEHNPRGLSYWLDAMEVLVPPKAYPKRIGWSYSPPSAYEVYQDWQYANSWNNYFGTVIMDQPLRDRYSSNENEASIPLNPIARLHDGKWKLSDFFARLGKAKEFQKFLEEYFDGNEANLLQSTATLHDVIAEVMNDR